MNKRNNYPATLHNAFVIMKGWTTTVNQSHHKVWVAFNTMGHDRNNTHGKVNMAKGQEKYNGPACNRCGRDNHPVAIFFATKHANGTVLNTEGGVMINEVDNEKDEIEVSSICSDVFATVGNDIHELILSNDTNSQENRNPCFKGLIPGNWLLLYSLATIDVISNRDLLTNIKHVKTTLHIRCNTGVKTTTMRGNLSGYGPVLYFPNEIANILSLIHVK